MLATGRLRSVLGCFAIPENAVLDLAVSVTKLVPNASAFAVGLRGRLRGLYSVFARGRVGYRLVRRVCRLPCVENWASLFIVEAMSASVADLRTGRRGRRSYQVQWATESDVPAVTAFFGPNRPIARRVGRGDRCLVATVRDEICAAVWFAAGPSHYAEDARDLGCVLEFPARTAFSYDGKGTRLGAWGTMMAQAPDLLTQLGVDEVITLIDYDNHMSIRSHESLGYRRLGLIGCLRLAGWVQPFYRDGEKVWRMLAGRLGALELRRARSPHASLAHRQLADLFRLRALLRTIKRKSTALPSPRSQVEASGR